VRRIHVLPRRQDYTPDTIRRVGMYLRSFAITVALAVGLVVILALAFVIGIPAYLVNLLSLHQPRKPLVPPLPRGRLSRL
jgi:hypothetical protein